MAVAPAEQQGVRRWPVWALPARLRRYVVAAQGLAVVLLALAVATAPTSSWRWGDAVAAAAFVACGVLSVEVFRRVGAPYRRTDRPFNDLTAAFLLPAALLLPPQYGALVALPLNVLFQARVTRLVPYKWAFNTAVSIVVCIATAYVHLAFAPPLDHYQRHGAAGSPAEVGGLFVATLVYLVLNRSLVFGVVRRVPAAPPWRALVLEPEGWILALGDVCAGVVLTLAWMAAPALIVFALVTILLLQRAVIHTHLVTASRHDAKTGLATPTWWRSESGRAVTRARHGGVSVAVLVIDLDHFKAVNDRHGHLLGDAVLAAVADTIRVVVRPLDLVGRFGGDEFTVLLAGVDEDQAVATAERLRLCLADLRPSLPDAAAVVVTASLGIALFGRDGVELDALLSAADLAMYRAKARGGNRVCLADPTVAPKAGLPIPGTTDPQMRAR
jgi:diguanylate cyclase (GGDEF)-like protein